MATEKDAEDDADELREEYDFAQLPGGVRGKYAERLAAGTNLVRLEPDVARAFPSSAAVNEALRLLMQVAERTAKAPDDR
jgi:hypothetical protein